MDFDKLWDKYGGTRPKDPKKLDNFKRKLRILMSDCKLDHIPTIMPQGAGSIDLKEEEGFRSYASIFTVIISEKDAKNSDQIDDTGKDHFIVIDGEPLCKTWLELEKKLF